MSVADAPERLVATLKERSVMMSHIRSMSKASVRASVDESLPCPIECRHYDGSTTEEKLFNMAWDLQAVRGDPLRRGLYIARIRDSQIPTNP